MYKKIILLTFSLLVVATSSAYASVITSQTDSSSEAGITYQYGSSGSQSLGPINATTIYFVQVYARSSVTPRYIDGLAISVCQYSDCHGTGGANRFFYSCNTPSVYTNGNCRDYDPGTASGKGSRRALTTSKALYSFDFTTALDVYGNYNSNAGVVVPQGYYVKISYPLQNNGVSYTGYYYGSSADTYAGGSATFSRALDSGSISDLYFAIYDVGGAPPVATQILTTSPPYSITPISSPVTLSGTYAIGPEVGSSTPNLLITLLDTDNGNYSEYNFGLINTTPSTYSYSTTTGALADGRYHMSVLFDNSPNVYVATSSEFIVNKTITPISSLSLYFPATSTPITITTGLSECDSMLTASGIGCAVGTVFKNVLYLLFVPDTYTRLRFQEQYNDLKYKAPWGYIFLIANDISGYSTASTTSLSSANLSVTFPSNSNPLYNASSTQIFKGRTITFIDWSLMASSTSHGYWGNAWTSISNMISLLMGAGFFFWLWKFSFNKIRP